MKKRILGLFFTLAIVCGIAVTAFGADASGTYRGKTLIAVNTDFGTDTAVSGSVTTNSSSAENSIFSAEETYTQVSDGNIIVGTCELFDSLELIGPAPAMLLSEQVSPAAEYKPGDTKSIAGKCDDAHAVECLYIGTYCTVWGATEDDASICIDETIAKEIAEVFDKKYPTMREAFGEWFDVDGDEKVAIFCYDIDEEYPATRFSTVIYGFFRSADMLDANGYVNGLNFGKDNTKNLAMDCIHIDTYPAMGIAGNKLQDVERVYSTLIHEFQHLVNFSHRIEDSTGKQYYNPPVYLNEAFSMAAEHICFGPESCKEQRVDYFNNHARYDCGHALTYWDYSNTLPNYSNAYLFGQYLCTRYAQNANAGGTNVYRTILEEMKKAPKSEMLDTIAALLETTPYDLVTDFWTAVFLNQDSGKYGFNGEAWADQLTPYIHDIASLPNLSGNIKNGGAIAFRLDENGFTPDTKKSIAFIVIDENGNVAKDQPVKVTLQESTHGTITLPKFFVEGQTFTFAAKPETGCVFGGFRVDGVFSTNTEFKVTAPLTVSGVFTLPYDLGFGSCGKNTVWFLTDEDDNDVWETLTIFGSGSTYNYSYSTSNPSPVPWLSKATDIKNVIVDPGVKVLGSYLFYRHTQLKTITLPQSLVAIQPGVFYYCSALENANLPGSLEYIGKTAFYKCASLQSMNLPSSLETLNEAAFYGCAGLKSVTLPASITTVEKTVFYGCTGLEHVDLPTTIESIGEAAFYGCTGLKTITIPHSTTSVGKAAFYNCSNLQKVFLDHGIQSIGESAFYGCTSLEEAHYPGRKEQWSSVTVESGNDALISELIFEKVEIIETATEEGITLTVAQYDVEEADAFIAFYNEEQKLLFCEFVTLDTKDEEKSVTISSSRIGEAASYKVIILENDDNGHWMPLMSLYQKEL